MSTHDWMRDGYAPQAHAAPKARVAARERSVVEYVLAASGFAAWIWCAYEIAKALIH
jgi:hypothetical protein